MNDKAKEQKARGGVDGVITLRPGMQTPRAWVRLPSGRRLDLIHPSPDAWLDSDMAIRLGRVARWTGESIWEWPLSVAQHSLTVLALRRQWSKSPMSATAQLLELTHDMDEGLSGYDAPSPMKLILGQPFKDMGDRLMHCVRKRYQLPVWDKSEYAIHKRADITAAASEAVHCVGWTREEVKDVLKIEQPILDIDPLVQWYGCTPWEPWPAHIAADRFLNELERLLALASLEVSKTHSG